MTKFNRFLWTGLVLGLAACGDDVTVTNPPEPEPVVPGVTAVSVAPDGASINVGGTLGMTAAATLEPGAAAPTWAWSTSNAAIATVAGTTANATVTGVAAGSAGIRATATSGTSSASGVATVFVTAAPACAISGVAVTPSEASLVTNQSLQFAATVTGTNCATGDLGVTWTVVGSPAGATISSSGVFSATAAGNYVVRATSTKDATKTNTAAVTVIVPAPATVSIQSITQYATNVPVDLTNVGGQIEISLNVDPGAAPQVTKAQALIDGIVVAEQVMAAPSAEASAPETAPQTLVLSTNTRQVKKVGSVYVPVIHNGPRQITARIFVTGSTVPAVSNAVPVVMQNADAWVPGTTPALAPASTTPSFTNNVPATGTVWYKGNVNFTGGPNYIAFFPVAPTVNATSAACGNSSNATVGSPTGGITLAGTFTCGSTVEGGVSITGYSVTPGTAPAPDYFYIAASGVENVGSPYTVDGSTRYNLLGTGTLNNGNTVFIDNKAPTITANPIGFLSGAIAAGDALPNNCEETGITPGCWVGSSYNLLADFASTDAGTGVNAASQGLYVRDGSLTTPCTATTFSIAGAAENTTPNVYDICSDVADNIGNVAAKVAGFNMFGVDKTNPTLAYAGSYGTSSPTNGVNPPEVNVLPAAAQDTVNFSLTDNNSGVDASVGLAVTFTRVLNNGGVVSTTACSNPVNTLTGSGTAPQFMLTPYLISSCALPGERTWSAIGRDRAGNSAGPIQRQLEYNPAAPVIAAVNIVPNYAAAADVALDVLATDDEDLKGGEMWVHTTTNVGNDIRVIFGPKAGFFTNLWGSDWDGQLKLFNTLAVDSRLTLPAAYSLAGYVESVANFAAGQAPVDTLSTIVYDTYGTPSAGWVTALNPAFVNAASYSPAGAHPWAAGLGNVIGATYGGVGTQCTFEYTTPTNNPEVFTRVWVVNENAGNFTVLGDVNAQPVLVSDNGIQRLYRYTLSNSVTCANFGGTGVAANNMFAIKSNVAAIIF